MTLAYLTDIIILLAAAVVTVPLARVIGLGTVPGFLLAGIVVGPSALSLIDNAEEIRHLAELGVVFLLFMIALELPLERLLEMRRLVFGVGFLQVALGTVVIGLVAWSFGNSFAAATLPAAAPQRHIRAYVPRAKKKRVSFNSSAVQQSM